jgi:hypothetical protein
LKTKTGVEVFDRREERMKRRRAVAGVLALLLATSVAGCGGGGAELKSEVRTTTTGQELLDLKKALDSGAMTQQEYEAHRKRVLESK